MASVCKRRAKNLRLFDFANPQPIDLKKLFGDSPLGLELGIGKGRFLRDLSKKHPEMSLVGVEIKIDRANRAALKLEDEGLKNSLVYCVDVLNFFKHIDSSFLFKAIYLNFPDPWPKQRHQRRRMLAPHFIEIYEKHLEPGGSLVFVTDDLDYALEGQQNMRANQKLVDLFGGIRTDWPCYPVSIHEEKFRLIGRTIHYQKFIKKVRE